MTKPAPTKYGNNLLLWHHDDQWIENFRMKIETFASLCRDLETSLAPSDHAVRDVVDVQKQVAITLYWLASSAEYEQSTCFSFMENFGVHEYTCIVNPSRPPYIDVSENVLVITNTLHDK
jgi:hypothetical protein